MNELLPVVLGLAVGGAAALVHSMRSRAILLPIASIVAGASASAINGEFADERWALFLTFDALLVWICAFASYTSVRGFARLRSRRKASSAAQISAD